MENTKELFKKVKTIKDEYDDSASKTGEKFNIFKIIGTLSNEVKHSAFLAELLNVQGSHGQGCKYLNLFLEQLHIENTDFDAKTSKAVVEFRIGHIIEEKKEGGYIDILLRDNYNQYIVIENKIYADDQDYQLKRYHNYLLKQTKDDKDKFELFYLNLHGDKPQKNSFDDLKEDADYRIITYRDDISAWLKKCLEAEKTNSIMQEAIRQYYNSIKLLTNQTLSDKMKNEIKDLIKNPEYFKTIPDIVDAYESLKKDIYNKFFNKFNEIVNKPQVRDKYQLIIPNKPDKVIQLTAGEDPYGFYFAYRLVKKDNTKRCRFKGLNDELYLEEDGILKKKDNEDLFEKYTYEGPKYDSSEWSLFYYYPVSDSNNKKLMAVPEFLSFLDDDVLTRYINHLLERTEKDFDYLRQIK